MSCQIKPHELRAKNNSGAASTVKLPVCESILTSLRQRLWTHRGWAGLDMQARMRYLGCMWGFEMGAYTKPEPGCTDHIVDLVSSCGLSRCTKTKCLICQKIWQHFPRQRVSKRRDNSRYRRCCIAQYRAAWQRSRS